jgi:hypothetical protein
MVDDASEEMHFEPERIEELPTDESSQCCVSGCARGPAKSPPRSQCTPSHVRDGKAAALSMYTSEAAALEAAGLSE